MTDFASLDTDVLQEYEALFIEAYRTQYPDYEWDHGSMLYEMVIRPAAVRAAADDADIEALRENMSLYLASIAESPDQDLILSLASNFRVSQNTGLYGTGDIAVYTKQAGNIYLPGGSQYSAGGLAVTNDLTYVGVPNIDEYVDTEDTVYRQLTQLGDEYVFLVPVRTVNYTGESVTRGVQVTSATRPSQVTRIETATSIAGGREPDSTEEILDQALNGMTAKVPSGNSHLEALFRDFGAVTIYSQASFGINDPECIRDRDNVFGISAGGRVDTWCRTADAPIERTIQVLASRATSTSPWQLFITAEQGLGFYRIESIKHPESSSIVTDEHEATVIYGYSEEDGGPHVFSGDTARYSVYQTAQVLFTFNDIADTDAVFEIVVSGLPGLQTLQEYINRRDIRNEAHDVLVRAPNPAAVSITVTVERESGDTATTVTALQTAIASAINATEIGIDGLDASLVVNAVEGVNSDLNVKFPVTLQADFQQPDGTVETVRSITGRINVPESDYSWVTERNTMFYCIADFIKVDLRDKA